jgi:heat-inducible transcriptional repressor
MRLTERQERILQTIVERYIATAHPVGSAAALSASGLAVSSATIRNEMAVLEELGYIHHLHTSGGRVPTNAGYRYYVEHLMRPRAVSGSEARTIRHELREAQSEPQEWLRLAAAILASRIHNVGLITSPRAMQVRLRHVEIISLHDAVVMLLVVLQDGTVLQEMLSLVAPRTQEELSPLADRVSRELRGMSARQVEATAGSRPEPDRAIVRAIAHLVRRAEERHAQVYHAGLAEMIRQPEFIEPRLGEPVAVMNERIRQMVDFLYQGMAVEQFIATLPEEQEITILVGAEAAGRTLTDYSFVVGKYVGRDDSTGYLGVIGPTRMEYPRAVGIVRYMTALMTDAVSYEP